MVDPTGRRSNSIAFTYTAPQNAAPSISAISPSFAPVGYSTQVMIVGANLVGGGVSFGGTPISGACGAECVVNSPSSLPAGNVSVTVAVNGLTSNAVTFLVTSGTPPTIAAVDFNPSGPNRGAPGGYEALEIDGTGFDTTTIANNQFFIGPNAVTPNQCFSLGGSPPQQECRGFTPPGAGNAYVTLKTPAGATNPQFNTDLFQYVPVLSALGVPSGPAAGGTAVTLSGQGLAVAGGTTHVYFGANPALDVSCTAAQCLATSPPGSGTAAVTVTIANQLPGGTFTTPASAALSYTYIPPPAVTGVSPNSGPVAGGTAVTIAGTGFSTATGATTIGFGGVAATGVRACLKNVRTIVPWLVVRPLLTLATRGRGRRNRQSNAGYGRPSIIQTRPSCASATSCAATSPAGCSTVDVTVTVGGGTSATGSTDQFSYTPAGAPCPPILQSPAEGTQNISTTPAFTWQAPQGAVAGSTVYTLYISQGGQTFATTATSYAVPASAAIAPGTEIFWTVSACNGAACSPYARAWGEFTAPQPGAPGLTSPIEGSTGDSFVPTVQWTAASGAVSGVTQYTAAIWDPGANVYAYVWTPTTGFSGTVPAGSQLQLNHFYYYAVQACNESACGPLARWEGFTTTSP